MAEVFLKPPLAGVNRKAGFQSQEPYTSLNSTNFWPRDPRTGRQISAVRPPLELNANQPGDPGTVNYLSNVGIGAAGQVIFSVVAAMDGDIYYHNTSDWVAVSSAKSVTTGRAVFGTGYIQQNIICNDDELLVLDMEPTTPTLTSLTATAGSVPTDTRMAVTWRGALVVAGAPAEPHIFYISRLGNIQDWDFTATDNAAAFAATGEQEGVIGKRITAVIPATSDVLIIASEDSIFALRGHPRRGGELEVVSRQLGILGQGAWTQTSDGQIFFMSKHGLAELKGTQQVSLVSKEKIPDELIALYFNPIDPRINVEYDFRWKGIHITVRDDLSPQSWMYDLELGGFHQQELPSYPFVTLQFDGFSSQSKSSALFAGVDGIRQFNTEGTEVISYGLTIGPFKLSESSSNAMRLERCRHLFGSGTKAGTLSAPNVITWGGQTAEDVVRRRDNDDAMIRKQATLDNVLDNNLYDYPMVGGSAFLIDIEGSTYESSEDEYVAYEGTEVFAEPLSRKVPIGITGQTRVTANTSGQSFQTSLFRVYAEATLGTSLSDYGSSPSIADQKISMLLVDLTDMPSSWWDFVRSDGGDIRVTNASNELLDFRILDFDKNSRSGTVAFNNWTRSSGSVTTYNVSATDDLDAGDALAPEDTYRLWCGNPLATHLDPLDASDGLLLVGFVPLFGESDVVDLIPRGAGRNRQYFHPKEPTKYFDVNGQGQEVMRQEDLVDTGSGPAIIGAGPRLGGFGSTTFSVVSEEYEFLEAGGKQELVREVTLVFEFVDAPAQTAVTASGEQAVGIYRCGDFSTELSVQVGFHTRNSDVPRLVLQVFEPSAGGSITEFEFPDNLVESGLNVAAVTSFGLANAGGNTTGTPVLHLNGTTISPSGQSWPQNTSFQSDYQVGLLDPNTAGTVDDMKLAIGFVGDYKLLAAGDTDALALEPLVDNLTFWGGSWTANVQTL